MAAWRAVWGALRHNRVLSAKYAPMELTGNHGQSRRALHELDCALSGPGSRRGTRENLSRSNIRLMV